MDPFQYLLSLETFGIKFGLENIRTLTAALGNPQNSFKNLLIAGTNGKGSVSAMVDRALRAAGVRTGRYTSPHLVHLEERFCIDGYPIDTAALGGVINHLRAVINALLEKQALEAPPTFFETTTAAALEAFRTSHLEAAVLEVGLGGRLDATNVVDPVAAAITSIDFDHEQYLGTTLAAIAREKAGVIRPGIPVVVGSMAADARASIAERCAAMGATLVGADADVDIAPAPHGRVSARIRTGKRNYGQVRLALRGDHQIPNALVAVRLLEELEPLWPIDASAIVTGLTDVRWPGRLQLLEVEGRGRVLLDAAHNPAGALALARYLAREHAAPLPIVFGAMRDKDTRRMLETLLPHASVLVLTSAATARARPPDALADEARRLAPGAPVHVAIDPGDALGLAWSHAPMVCAAGSLFLIGELIAHLGTSAREL